MRRRRSAFTILELLVVIGVITLLIAILIPALQAGRQAALDLKCRTNQHTVATEFVFFAEPSAGRPRGDSERLGGNQFRLEDFQESMYRVAEFWDAGPALRQTLSASNHPMMCPAGPSTLERVANRPCDQGAVGPKRNISTGLNMRLRFRTRIVNERAVSAQVLLTDKILQYPDVPLLLDVDGELAEQKKQDLVYYTAPPPSRGNVKDIFVSGDNWFPALRHRDRVNVAFIGGHVLSSADPLAEPWWRWDFSPEPLP
jgi:prepilin-type processing-associated H-X9-DG protein